MAHAIVGEPGGASNMSWIGRSSGYFPAQKRPKYFLQLDLPAPVQQFRKRLFHAFRAGVDGNNSAIGCSSPVGGKCLQGQPQTGCP